MNTDTSPSFLRRLGPDPHANGAQTEYLAGCPDLWESDSGSFLVIGRNVTEALKAKLPRTVGCGPDELIIEIPRRTLLAARSEIQKLA